MAVLTPQRQGFQTGSWPASSYRHSQRIRPTQSNQNWVTSRSSAGHGVLVGLLSAFGSAAILALLFAFVYFLRYTSRGRIILDALGRPGEFDDEAALAREEAEALERMDDIERMEYFRAKGMCRDALFMTSLYLRYSRHSLRGSKPTRLCANRYKFITILSDSRKRR